MRNSFISRGVLWAAVGLCWMYGTQAHAQSAATSPYDSVDARIGTAGGGNTFPGATVPFGMVQFSPDTNPDAWYRYDEKSIMGF